MTKLPFYIVSFFLAIILSYPSRLQAQDTLSDKRALSAIPVSQEPRHHNIFENKWVRILDVRIPPGDTSLFHRHATPSVFIVLSNTKTGSEAIIEPVKPQFIYGNIWFEGFYDKPRIHRVWNSDTSWFHVMDIELPNRENRKMDPPVKNTAADSPTLLFDEKPVRCYRFTLLPHTNLRLKRTAMPALIVNLDKSNGKLSVNGKQFSRKGDFAFIEADTLQEFSNQQDATAELAVFYLK